MKTTRETRRTIRNKLLKQPAMGGIIAELQNCLRDAYDDLDIIDAIEFFGEPEFVGKMPVRREIEIRRQDHETIDKSPEEPCFMCAKTASCFITTFDSDVEQSGSELSPICVECVQSLGAGILIKDSRKSVGWRSPNGIESLSVVNKRAP